MFLIYNNKYRKILYNCIVNIIYSISLFLKLTSNLLNAVYKFQILTIIECSISGIAKPSNIVIKVVGTKIITIENIKCVNHSLYNKNFLFK